MKPTLSFTEEIDLIDAHGCKNTIKRAVRLGMGIRENTGIHSWQAGRMEVPVYEGLPYPLWGLTARITWWLLERYGDILTGML